MRLLAPAVIALCACGRSVERAPAQGSGSGSGSGSEAARIPLAARCSGRWHGTIKWTKPTCGDPTLAVNAPFDLTISAGAHTWNVAYASPAGASTNDVSVQWDVDGKNCTASVGYTLLSGRHVDLVTLELAMGAGGATAHAVVDHTSTVGEPSCVAEGSTIPEHTPDDGRVPAVTERRVVGTYALTIKWSEPGNCGANVTLPGESLRYRLTIDPARGNRLVLAGFSLPAGTFTLDRSRLVDDVLQMTAGVDVGAHRHVLVQELTVAGGNVSGNVLFSVLDGDLVTCTRNGTVTGSRTSP